MLTTFAEVRAIPDVTPSIPDPLSLVAFDQLFGTGCEVVTLPACEERRFLPGQPIITRGLVPNRMFVLVEGIAVLDTSDEISNAFSGRVIKRSEVVALAEMLACAPVNYDVSASTECLVRSYSRSDVLEFLAANPETRSHVITILAEFNRDADRILKLL